MEEIKINYEFESGRIAKGMGTRTSREDVKDNIKNTAEKTIGYL